MSAIVIYRLQCDTCTSSYSPVPGAAAHVRDVRRRARTIYGWRRLATGGDICERCVASGDYRHGSAPTA